MNERIFCFAGGARGQWSVRQQTTMSGEALEAVTHVATLSAQQLPENAQWNLHGVFSNERYVERSEKEKLVEKQEGLGRPLATFAALILIRKNATWWALTQDERRSVFETQSHHIAIGMKYLPPIARKLHHCRDLPNSCAFDFLTWFEYAPEHESHFNDMLAELRDSPEWRYIDREVDIRLQRA